MPQPRAAGNILSAAYGALTRVVGGLWSRYGGYGWSRIRMLLPGAIHDWEREAGDTWRNAIVGLAISWLGDRFSRPRIVVAKIARNGDHVPLGRHALVDLWQRPNPHYGRRTLEKAVGLSLKVDGNAYLYKVRDRLGRVIELWWIPHFIISPTWPMDGSVFIDGYLIRLDGVQYWLPASEVIHIRDGIDPRNERLGIAALRSCLREVCTVNQEGSYTAALLKNSGVPGVAIVPDSEQLRPSPDDAERIKEKFSDEFAGDNAGGAVVMAGKYKVQVVGFSPEQLALDKLPQSAAARIAASIGVAAMSLGLPDPGKTYSNLAEANRTSWGTIVAIQDLIAEALRWQLLTEPIVAGGRAGEPGDPYALVIEFDYSHIQELQEELDAVHTRIREDWKSGLIRLAVAQEQLGYDVDPSADRYFPGTDSTEPAMPAPTGPPGPADGDDGAIP